MNSKNAFLQLLMLGIGDCPVDGVDAIPDWTNIREWSEQPVVAINF